MKNDLVIIRRLVGRVTKEQLRHVDCFVSAKIAMFMPVGGACFYALTPEHTHPSYMFILHFNDQTSVKLYGKVLVSEPGKVAALSPNIPHQELPSDSPPRYIGMFIDKRFFEKQYGQYTKKKSPLFYGESHDADPRLFSHLKRFMIEADNRILGASAMLDALAIEICHYLIRAFIKTPSSRSWVSDRAEIGRVIEYLYSHAGDKLTVETLAGVAHLSPSHFTRVFREDLGKSPMEYVNELRLERAKKLLLAGGKSMTEIALDCGFGSSSYLSSSFHQAFKMTPSEYQRSVSKRQSRVKGQKRRGLIPGSRTL